jgi:hypothetical protein
MCGILGDWLRSVIDCMPCTGVCARCEASGRRLRVRVAEYWARQTAGNRVCVDSWLVSGRALPSPFCSHFFLLIIRIAWSAACSVCAVICAVCYRPLYLTINIAGRKYDRWANHFNPYSPIYSRRERGEIVISDIALSLVFAGLYAVGRSYGWLWLLKVRHMTIRERQFPDLNGV